MRIDPDDLIDVLEIIAIGIGVGVIIFFLNILLRFL